MSALIIFHLQANPTGTWQIRQPFLHLLTYKMIYVSLFLENTFFLLENTIFEM